MLKMFIVLPLLIVTLLFGIFNMLGFGIDISFLMGGAISGILGSFFWWLSKDRGVTDEVFFLFVFLMSTIYSFFAWVVTLAINTYM